MHELAIDLDSLVPDHFTGNSNYCTVVRNIVEDDRTRTDTYVVPDGDISENGSVAPDNYVVTEGGVPLAFVGGDSAQCDSLVEGHIITDDGGLSDDDPGRMVDEEPLSDGGSGVNVTSRQLVGLVIDLSGLLLLAFQP